MVLGVITDIVMRERADYIAPPARFEGSRLFADHFECSAHTQPIEILRDPQCGVVGYRIDVVFGIEPQHDVDRRARSAKASRRQVQAEKKKNQNALHRTRLISW